MQKACCLPGLQDFFRKAKEVRGSAHLVSFGWAPASATGVHRQGPRGYHAVTVEGKERGVSNFLMTATVAPSSKVQHAWQPLADTVVGTPDIQITAPGRAFGGRIRNMANKLFT